ncbi:hypothetical protein HAX54_025339 [Datura stramonium]|uniref:Uncharacterized protein n=1 Tax=Datura stramonium TaxID=4076 RepID=A0ABS8V1N9_DATST|nr:hypothetical protein [Datura stramonium]
MNSNASLHYFRPSLAEKHPDPSSLFSSPSLHPKPNENQPPKPLSSLQKSVATPPPSFLRSLPSKTSPNRFSVVVFPFTHLIYSFTNLSLNITLQNLNALFSSL